MPLQRTRSRALLGRSPLNGGSLGGLCCVVAIVLGTGELYAAPSPGAPRLGAIEVRAFDPKAGQFVDDLADRNWNQIDLSLLTTVELEGPASAPQTVEVTVLKGKKRLLKRKARAVIQSGKYFIPVWIEGPFCEDVTIRAQLLGTEQKSERRLVFRCGE
jgi:hypothetical protein